MLETRVCECIGVRQMVKKTDGKKFYISYCRYDFDNPDEGSGCFSVFDQLVIGDTYSFVFSNGKPQIVQDK